MAVKKKKAPGKNIEDWQRGTERLTLRLPPTVMALLRERAEAEGGAGAYVSKLVLADAVAAELAAPTVALQTTRKRVAKAMKEAGVKDPDATEDKR